MERGCCEGYFFDGLIKGTLSFKKKSANADDIKGLSFVLFVGFLVKCVCMLEGGGRVYCLLTMFWSVKVKTQNGHNPKAPITTAADNKF